ncbi:MAG: DUF4198 domain-containing protein [Sandaracinaceae bacterium]
MTARPLRVVLVVAAALVASGASAHDFVLWPDPGRRAEPGPVTLGLRVGDHLALGDERGYRADRVARFAELSAGGLRRLHPGRAGSEPPFARVESLRPGGHWLVVDRVPIDIELAADRFDAYLRHERLTAVRRERSRRGEASRAGRERYSRHLKAFVQVGEAPDGVGCRAVGQAFEVVPLHDAATLRAGHALDVELRIDGSPAARHPLSALTRAGGDVHEQALTTDERGRARVRLGSPGRWVLRSVTMSRCEGCEGSEWRSRWTAMTVDVRPPGPPPVPCSDAPR